MIETMENPQRWKSLGFIVNVKIRLASIDLASSTAALINRLPIPCPID